MLITYVYIIAVQKAFISHGYISKNTDPLITRIMLNQQFPLKRLIPGVRLDTARIKAFPRIRQKIRKDLLFQPFPVVISFRNIVDGFFQMIFEYIMGCEKHHIKRLRRL